MFSAELQGIGKVLETVFTQGGLFYETYLADVSTPETKWYLLIFSAALVYGFVDLIIHRRRRR